MLSNRPSQQLSRRALLGALLGGTAGAAFANAPLTSIRPAPRAPEIAVAAARSSVDALINKIGLTGSVSFAVADADTGEVLEAKEPGLGLPPASVTKAVTALYALDALGPGHRFETRLVATGPIKNGVIEGHLALEGGGDPALDTDALGEMARQLRERGIRGITGKFLVCSGALPSVEEIDPDQPNHVGYNPAVSGLNLNYNRVYFEWKRQQGGYAVSMDARARHYAPTVNIATMRVVERAVPVYTYADAGGSDEWTVARPALGKGGSRWLPVRKPEGYAAEVFKTIAASLGISLPAGRVVIGRAPAGQLLVRRLSAPLSDVLRGMLKYSTNLTAEVAGLAATTAGEASFTDLAGSASAMTKWARGALGTGEARFVDHSGLGDRSRVNARDMVMALLHPTAQTSLPSILKSIPMRSEQGEVLPDHPIKILAKTGTLNFVSSLAGYATAPGGRRLAFAFFSADMAKRRSADPAAGEVPPGSRAWKSKSRRLQLQLIERWGAAFAA